MPGFQANGFTLGGGTPSPFMAPQQQYDYTLPFSNYGGGNGMTANPGVWGGSGSLDGGAAAPGRDWSWLDKTDPITGAKSQGVAGIGLGAASGIFNAWMGMKQYGLAKDQLAEGKKQFQLNYDAQKTTTNSQLEDRQRARVSSAPAGAYQSVGDYMAKNGIK